MRKLIDLIKKSEIKGEVKLDIPIKEFIVFLVLSGFIFGIFAYKNIGSNDFFETDYKVKRRVLDDLVDSKAKLKSIIGNPLIEQSVNKPEMGGSVAFDGNYYTFVPKIKVNFMIKYKLANVPYHDYANDGYIFYPNYYFEFSSYLSAMVIEKKDITPIGEASKIKEIVNIKFIEVGMLLVKEIDGSFYITTTNNFDMIAVNKNYINIKFSKETFLAKNNFTIDKNNL